LAPSTPLKLTLVSPGWEESGEDVLDPGLVLDPGVVEELAPVELAPPLEEVVSVFEEDLLEEEVPPWEELVVSSVFEERKLELPLPPQPLKRSAAAASPITKTCLFIEFLRKTLISFLGNRFPYRLYYSGLSPRKKRNRESPFRETNKKPKRNKEATLAFQQSYIFKD
jgi:hypothetical protein